MSEVEELKVLFLDDESKEFPLFAALYKQIASGFAAGRAGPPSECDDFARAMDLVRDFRWDLAIIDLSWDTLPTPAPVNLGRSLVQACRLRSPNCVIVAMTKVGSNEYLAHLREFADFAVRMEDAFDDLNNFSLQIAQRLQSKRAEPSAGVTDPASLFIVHGHDSRLRNEVELLLRQAGLQPTVLLAQPHKGRTLIEKLETEARSCKYAIILATADDVGNSNVDPSGIEDRARQNVVYELGWFHGKLNRERVVIVRDPSVSLPSDLGGIGYITSGSWKLELLKELQSAGFEVDFSSIT